ncbi:MAG TPA: dihydrodipicolinate synthase family protein [Geminicoccaceae bacterium]|nr:dihydrodipicolinate synthase family protein [Geminicoccaceae bacterium]
MTIRIAADAADRAAAFAVRRAVFVDEQGVSLGGEFDGLDEAAQHLVAERGGRIVGTLRWRVIDGGARVKIERVAVLVEARGAGVGGAMLRFLLDRLDREGSAETVLYAQLRATRFYERLGYVAEGEAFDDEGIPHVRMRRVAPAPGTAGQGTGMGLWQEPVWACCAVATPLTDGEAIDTRRLAALGRRLMDLGVNGLALFGTTGEGPCFPATERIAACERLLRQGLPAGRLILGIGSAVPEEAAWMARQAGALGLAAVLATPPFYFKEVSDEGLFRAYAALVERAGPEAPPVILYHIPSVTGIALSHGLIERLATAFPVRILGVKDSGADWSATARLLERFPQLAVTVGAEEHVRDAVAAGARGTICGLANVAPRLVARLVRGEAAAAVEMEALGRAFDGLPFLPALKAMLADALDDAAWRAVLPPLVPFEGRLAVRAQL